ncbi:uncharacterized protein [Dysidea avara]|uniref:uncharacterized protein n=1 Tax=Dysidea avara TaxID=196820 RepID=UPI00331777E0
MLVTNTGDGNLTITNIEGYYCTTNDGTGGWVKCDDAWIGVESYDDYRFLDIPNFNIESAKTVTLAVRLNIKIPELPGTPRPSLWRAHHSLPQPLHLKAVFTDHKNHTTSIRFEFGNPPLHLNTVKTWESNWEKGGLYAYCFADNANTLQRSDAAVYFEPTDGVLCYHPVLEGSDSSNIYYIESVMEKQAYKAVQAGETEIEIKEYAKRNDMTEMKVYALIDLKEEIAYGLKMIIKTPTSFAITHCLLPKPPNPTTMSLTVSPESVKVGSDVIIKWKVPRAAKKDYIYVYTEHGKKSIDNIYMYNEQAQLSGEVIMKAPNHPGIYEARYYPASLSTLITGYYHDIYWLKTKFTVVQ